jgi:catechol 2,3-dioxygenase-like lactoylglutathione lyase family enzyme
MYNAPVVSKAHISLNVRNVPASIDFYRKLFGIEPIKVRQGYAKFDVSNPALNLSLNEMDVMKGGNNLSHLGLQVASTADVLSIRDRWQAEGLAPRSEMQTSCCFALQDKAWITDPDGNEWEVFTVLADVEMNTGQCCASPAAGDNVVSITSFGNHNAV